MSGLVDESRVQLEELLFTKSTEWPASVAQEPLMLLNFCHALQALSNKDEVRGVSSRWEGRGVGGEECRAHTHTHTHTHTRRHTHTSARSATRRR